MISFLFYLSYAGVRLATTNFYTLLSHSVTAGISKLSTFRRLLFPHTRVFPRNISPASESQKQVAGVYGGLGAYSVEKIESKRSRQSLEPPLSLLSPPPCLQLPSKISQSIRSTAILSLRPPNRLSHSFKQAIHPSKHFPSLAVKCNSVSTCSPHSSLQQHPPFLLCSKPPGPNPQGRHAPNHEPLRPR